MSGRILHIADIHLGKKQYGLACRATDYQSAFMATLAQAQQGDLVVIAGDLFDSREPGPLAYRWAKEAILGIKAKGVEVVAVEGNHDRLLFDKVGHTWMHLLHREEVLYVLGRDGEPEIINPFGIRVVGIPYRGHKELEALEQIAEMLEPLERVPTILLCHIGITDVAPNMGGITQAEDFDILRPYVDYVATGHFHKTWENGFIHCPGPLEPTSISDASGGYFHVLGLDLEEVGFVPLESYHTPRRIIKGQRVGSLEELRERGKDWASAIVQLIYTGDDVPSMERILDTLSEHPPLKVLPSYDVKAREYERDEDRPQGEIEREVLEALLDPKEVQIAQQLKRYALDGETPETIAQYAVEAACQ